MLPVRAESWEKVKGQPQSSFLLVCFHKDSGFGEEVLESGARAITQCLQNYKRKPLRVGTTIHFSCSIPTPPLGVEHTVQLYYFLLKVQGCQSCSSQSVDSETKEMLGKTKQS